MINFYVDTPTGDMQKLVISKLREAGFDWKDGCAPYQIIGNVGIYLNKICDRYNTQVGQCVTYSEMLRLLKITKIQLNSDYSAIINHNNKTVIVGCQTFSFEKIKELYNATLS